MADFDFKTFVATHPALTSAIMSLQEAMVQACEDAAKALVAEIPIAGPIIEDVATPVLDLGAGELEKAIVGILQKIGIVPGAPAAPVPVALKAAPAPAPAYDPVAAAQSVMKGKQAAALVRAANTKDLGQRAQTDAAEAAEMGTAP